MKTVSIMAFAFFMIYMVKKAKPNVDIYQNHKPMGINLILDNERNKQGFPIGPASDFEHSFKEYRTRSEVELRNLIEAESLNLYQASNALVLLANLYLQQENVAKGLPLLKVAAYDYHHPLAMVILGRAHYHGFTIKSVTPPQKDLKEAYYLVNRAFQTADLMLKKTGEKYALDKSVAMGLGLLDSYQLFEIKKEFNPQDSETELGLRIQDDLGAFAEMYGL